MSTARTTELTLSARANGYVALTKPDVSFLVLMTTAAGYYMGARGPVAWLHMLHAVFGTMLIAAGTAALNHYIERESDGCMRRTALRPLPSGVLQPREALIFGGALAIAGGLWVLLLRRQVGERTSALAAANRSLVHEVEEREKAQAGLKRALDAERELGELKSRFVSLVSHEFRTPLGITMSAVELLRNYLDRLPPRKLKELLEDIYSSTLRMSGLMEQVLLLGRVEAGKLGAHHAPIDLAALADKLVDETLSASNRKCPIQLTVENSLDGVEGDESLLRHILSNLLSNAVKYSPNGRAVQFIAQRNGNDLVFIVRDQGIGIPEADRPHLFEAFHRASNVGQTQGTGLGLLIVKRCVELLDGQITFDSREDVGTTFTVRLPLFAAAPPSPPRSSSFRP